jgi:hypothetical protein
MDHPTNSPVVLIPLKNLIAFDADLPVPRASLIQEDLPNVTFLTHSHG